MELPDPPGSWGLGPTRTCWSARSRSPGAGAGSWPTPRTSPISRRVCTKSRSGSGGCRNGGGSTPMATVASPATGRGHRGFRGAGQALRGRGGPVPTAARQPQGQRGEGQPPRRATLVADPARHGHRRRRPGVAGRVLRPGRRHPGPPPRRAVHHRGSPGEPADNDTTGATLSPANGRSSRRPALTDGLIRQRRQATLRP